MHVEGDYKKAQMRWGLLEAILGATTVALIAVQKSLSLSFEGAFSSLSGFLQEILFVVDIL